ncbi:MAG: Gfo/Idh/MocA family protein [Candidatus Merdivicinus sp.]
MKQLNFAIVGCGVIALTHAKAMKQTEECHLYAVCDIIPEKADKFAAEHGAEKVYYDYHELLADTKVDAVCVCVPSGTHGEVCIAASNAGKAIVCEKPMEITPEKIAEVIRVVEQNHTKMQCIFQRRMMPVAIAVKKAVEEGKFGKIVLADAYLKYYRDQAYYNSAGWRGTWELDGGGALMNQGVHGVDLILWMLGDQVKSLYGRAETLARNIVVEDTAAAILKMEKGAICVIEGATTVYPGQSTTFAIHGEKGTVVFNDEGIVEWNFLDKEDAPQRPDELGEAVGGSKAAALIGVSGHVMLLRDLALSVLEDRQPMIPPREATTAVKVICSIYESTRTGKEIYF